MWGSSNFKPGQPFRTVTSTWFNDATRKCTNASPALGLGIGKSAYCKTSGPPCCWKRIVFIFFLLWILYAECEFVSGFRPLLRRESLGAAMAIVCPIEQESYRRRGLIRSKRARAFLQWNAFLRKNSHPIVTVLLCWSWRSRGRCDSHRKM